MKHKLKAKADPRRYLSVILDGMDQNKTSIPHFAQPRKINQLKLHLTGAILHAHGIYGYFDYGQFNADCNNVLTVLINILLMQDYLPDILYVQLDNCFRENKNRYDVIIQYLRYTKDIYLCYTLYNHLGNICLITL